MPLVLVAVAVSWLGLYVHNVADLPGQTLLSPETLYPTLVLLALVGWWLATRWRWPLLVWAWLHLIGGGVLSVLPVPWWPFDPEQSWRHYAFHLLYAATQVPLIVSLVTRRRRR